MTAHALRLERSYPDDPRLLDYLAAKGSNVGDAWQERANCATADPDAFYPEKGGSPRKAKKVCMACEVRTECLEDALRRGDLFGIWGGMSERERRRLKRQAA